MPKSQPLLSVVVPVYNERAGLFAFHTSLQQILEPEYKGAYEIVYVNDGSTDSTLDELERTAKNKHVKIVSLSRNFGKEIATTAGIATATGQAIITIDADGQHPVELIPEFVKKWRMGKKVVVGVRTLNQKEGLTKRLGSKMFYKFFNFFTGMNMLPGSTDFRLIDQTVQREFNRMTGRNRMTRALIDWLGYEGDYIYFKANARQSGQAGYSFNRLFKLAIDSVVSLSSSPLYISAYIGAVILPISIILGIGMLINLIAGDLINLHATGSAYVMVLLLFLVGILLVSQGIIGLYLSHIHTETQNRPLYIIDREKSVNLDEN